MTPTHRHERPHLLQRAHLDGANLGLPKEVERGQLRHLLRSERCHVSARVGECEHPTLAHAGHQYELTGEVAMK